MASKLIFKTPEGNIIPDEAVSPFDKKKEKIVIAMVKKALKLQEELLKFKADLYNKADELYTERLLNKGMSTDRKGNFTLFDYNKSSKIEMNVQENIIFQMILIWHKSS